MLFAFILLFCAVAFFLTGYSTVKIVKRTEWRVELHLPLLAIIFYPRKKRSSSMSAAQIRSIARRCADLLSKCDVLVSKIPRVADVGTAVPTPYKGYGITGAAIAFLESRARSLVAEDEAFNLSPDTDDKLRISFDTRLFHIARSLILIGIDMISLKFRRK